jgi:beta-lactamase superfamily II metal-dependent hydrolase
MGLEIDFLRVGDGERSGDAMALRYGSPYTGYEVMVVDGGDQDAGERLVRHIREIYGTSVVQHVVNTHPDSDHASGLSVVLEHLDVRNLWMHQPWNHANGMLDRFKNPRLTAGGLEDRVRAALSAAHDLEQIAVRRRIPIHEQYLGTMIGPFTVLSPDEGWYLQHLVPNFERTPAAKEPAGGLLSMAFAALDAAGKWVAESMNIETLDESGETSAQNESSVVLYGNFEGNGVLLTGDAGRQALTAAILFALQNGIALTALELFQVPHHGSRRNVSPTILNNISGKFAVISVSPGSSTHPRRKVTNALKRRGMRVYKTTTDLNHVIGWPRRSGVSDAEEIPFFDHVEA